MWIDNIDRKVRSTRGNLMKKKEAFDDEIAKLEAAHSVLTDRAKSISDTIEVLCNVRDGIEDDPVDKVEVQEEIPAQKNQRSDSFLLKEEFRYELETIIENSSSPLNFRQIAKVFIERFPSDVRGFTVKEVESACVKMLLGIRADSNVIKTEKVGRFFVYAHVGNSSHWTPVDKPDDDDHHNDATTENGKTDENGFVSVDYALQSEQADRTGVRKES